VEVVSPIGMKTLFPIYLSKDAEDLDSHNRILLEDEVFQVALALKT